MIFRLRLCRSLLLLALPVLPLHAATDGEVAARREAESLAGAFTNDGFKLRDGCWLGQLEPNKSKVIQVSLYAGNQYWFSLGATAPAKKLSVSIHDETGKAVAVEPFADEEKVAAGFSPQVSGPYYIRIASHAGAAAHFCLLYSYK